MSDRPNPADEYTGPADFAQQALEDQGTGSEIYQLVLHDIITRSEFGARKYGHPLRTTANVDYMTNMYQELLDMLIYVRGEIYRRDEWRKKHPGANLASASVALAEGAPYEPPKPVTSDPCQACLGIGTRHTCGISKTQLRSCCRTDPNDSHRDDCETRR